MINICHSALFYSKCFDYICIHPLPAYLYNAQVTIVGGDSSGVVDIFLQDGTSGYICADNGWNSAAATVACKVAGYDNGVARSRPIEQGEEVLMYNVRCSGSESNIGLCQYSGWTYGSPACQNVALLFCRKGNYICLDSSQMHFITIKQTG